MCSTYPPYWTPREESEDRKEDGSSDEEPEPEEEDRETEESAEEEPNTDDKKFLKNDAEVSSDPDYEPTDPTEFEDSESGEEEKTVMVDGAAITRVLADAEDHDTRAGDNERDEIPDVEACGSDKEVHEAESTAEYRSKRRPVSAPVFITPPQEKEVGQRTYKPPCGHKKTPKRKTVKVGQPVKSRQKTKGPGTPLENGGQKRKRDKPPDYPDSEDEPPDMVGPSSGSDGESESKRK